jgi:quinol monooxygenase YgiN
MVTVIAQDRTSPGADDEVAGVLALHVAATRAEPGCVEFTAYRADDDGDRFTLHERYVDEDAFRAHRASPHFAEYVEGRIVPLLVERGWQRVTEVAPAG